MKPSERLAISYDRVTGTVAILDEHHERLGKLEGQMEAWKVGRDEAIARAEKAEAERDSKAAILAACEREANRQEARAEKAESDVVELEETVECVIAQRDMYQRRLMAGTAQGATKPHWAVENPGVADHYRGVATAALEALGVADDDNLAPVDVSLAIEGLRGKLEAATSSAEASRHAKWRARAIEAEDEAAELNRQLAIASGEWEMWKAHAEQLERFRNDVAIATGICHEADTAWEPGPDESILKAVRRGHRAIMDDAGRIFEESQLRKRAEKAERQLSDLVDDLNKHGAGSYLEDILERNGITTDSPPGECTGLASGYHAMRVRAEKAEADLREKLHWVPPLSRCPITGLDHFSNMQTASGELVATYGGPFDSYTIPHTEEGEAPDEKELRCERYDHDRGCWVDGGHSTGLVVVDDEKIPELLDRIEKAETERDDYRQRFEALRGGV